MQERRRSRGPWGLAPLSTVNPRPESWDLRPNNWAVTCLTRHKILPCLLFANMSLVIDHQRLNNIKPNHPITLIPQMCLLRLRKSGKFKTHFLTISRDSQKNIVLQQKHESSTILTPLCFPDQSSNGSYLELSALSNCRQTWDEYSKHMGLVSRVRLLYLVQPAWKLHL